MKKSQLQTHRERWLPLRNRSVGGILALFFFSASSLAITAQAFAKPHAHHQLGKPNKNRKSDGATALKAVPGRSISEPSAARPLLTVGLPLDRAVLENGLRVVLAPDHALSTVTVVVTYNAGTRREERGQAGVANLLERLMHQGSANLSSGEHDTLVASHGGVAKGFAGSDQTFFLNRLPAGELPLALWLEADRMKSLLLTQSHLDAARAELRELIHDQEPLVRARAQAGTLSFQAYWPYEHELLSSLAELETAQLDKVKTFYESFYVPNNAVLCVVGDFEPDHAMHLIHRFFDTAKKQERMLLLATPPQPDQTSQRTAALANPHAVDPSFLYAWATPPDRTDEHYALAMAARLLAHTEASRLYQHLVHDKGLATEVTATLQGHHGPDLLTLEVHLADRQRRAEAERAVDAELEVLARSGPTESEMERLREQMQVDFVHALESVEARAIHLGEFELFYGDARLWPSELERYGRVRRDDIQAAVAHYLTAARRTLVEVAAAKDSEPTTGPARVLSLAPSAAPGQHRP